MLKSFIPLATTFFAIASCVFIPKIKEEQSVSVVCDTYTKELTLSISTIQANDCGNDIEAGACLLLLAVGVPAVSFVVSGSVVLVGNTLHWLEYQGACEESFLSSQIELLKSNI